MIKVSMVVETDVTCARQYGHLIVILAEKKYSANTMLTIRPIAGICLAFCQVGSISRVAYPH